MARYKLGTIRSGPFKGLSDKKLNFVIEYVKDFDQRRAAEASGYDPDHGYKLRKEPEIEKAIEYVLSRRLEISDITAEWVLMEAVDNVLIAKQNNQISASNTALGIVAKHVLVSAFAADKIDIKIDGADEIVNRLKRGRDRLQTVDDEPVTFL